MFTSQGSANESFLSGASPPTGVDLDYKKRNMVHSLSLREALIAFTGYFLMKGVRVQWIRSSVLGQTF